MSSKHKLWSQEEIEQLVSLRADGLTWDEISPTLENVSPNAARKAYYRYMRDGATPNPAQTSPKVLIFDIETAPIKAHIWGLFDQNVGLEMIEEDWSVLSWSAKWLGAPASEIMYRDQRKAKDLRNDKEILEVIWSLLDEADVVLSQNGIRFDSKKLNARFVIHGMKPPSSYKHIDTLRIAKKNFAFTSNKLAYMTEKLCTKYIKLEHGKFPGFKLWKECMAGNLEAWKEMELYNKHDVLALEELYVDHLAKWDNTVNFDWYTNQARFRCNCGSEDFVQHRTYHYTKKGKFAKYICEDCGKEHRDTKNLFTKDKRDTLRG